MLAFGMCVGVTRTSMTPASSVTLPPLLVVELPVDPPPPPPVLLFMEADRERRNVGRRRIDFLLGDPVCVWSFG